MNVLRSPTGSGLVAGHSDPQINISSSKRLDVPDQQVTFRHKRKYLDYEDTMKSEFSEMRMQMTQMMEMMASLSEKQTDFIKQISNDISTIKQQVSETKTSIETLRMEHNSLKTDVNTLLNKNVYTEKRLSEVEAKIKDLPHPTIDTTQTTAPEDILYELNERQRRSKNIIITNVPEPEASKSDMRQAADKNYIIDLMKKIIPDCPDPTTTIRLGKSIPNKSRPLKVCFLNDEPVKEILKNKHKYNLDTIKIFSDQTPQQRTNLKKVKEELKNRTEKGMKNLSIKYIKGVPKIVENSSKNLKIQEEVVPQST